MVGAVSGKHSPFLAATKVALASFVIGAEASNIKNVGIQLKNAQGKDLTHRGQLIAYLSDDANGDSVTASAPTTVAIGTDGLCIPLVAGKTFQLVSESDGDIDLNLTYAVGAATWYLVLCMPDGSIVASAAITFA